MKADRRDNNSLQNSGLKRREPPYSAPIGNSFDYLHLLLLIFFFNVIFLISNLEFRSKCMLESFD